VAVCPYGAIDIIEENLYKYGVHELGVTVPIHKTIREHCGRIGFCYYNCPQVVLDVEEAERRLFGVVSKDILGFYRRICITRAADDEIRRNAQSGGTITAILKFLLDKQIVNGAVICEADEEWKPHPKVIIDPRELIKGQKSKYTPCPMMIGVRDAMTSWGLSKVAFVGTPCQIRAVRAIQLSEFGVKRIAEGIEFTIGVFCYGTYFYADLFIKYLYNKHKISPKSITKIDLDTDRLRVYVQGELKLDVSRHELDEFLRESCKRCDEFTAKLSDVSVGGIGAPEGWNTVIIRTEKADKIINEAVDSGYLEIDDISEEGIEEIRKLAIRKLSFFGSLKETSKISVKAGEIK